MSVSSPSPYEGTRATLGVRATRAAQRRIDRWHAPLARRLQTLALRFAAAEGPWDLWRARAEQRLATAAADLGTPVASRSPADDPSMAMLLGAVTSSPLPEAAAPRPYSGETTPVLLPTASRTEPITGPRPKDLDPRPSTPDGQPADQTDRRSPGESIGAPDWAALRQSPGFALDRRLLDRMRRFLPTGVPPVTIKAGAAADRIARRYRADALAAGPLLLFRSGRWQPTAERGQALLGHELAHAAQAGSGGFPTGQVDALADEQAARRVEGRILGYWRYAASHGSATAETATTPAAAASASPSMPMSPPPQPGRPDSAAGTLGVAVLPSLPAVPPPSPGGDARPTLAAAPEGRTVEPQMPQRPADATLTSQQLRSLKDEIYEDLRRRIRIDFERGA